MRVLVRQVQRAFVLIAGVVLILLGVGMLVLPGPGLLVIVGGLAVLSTEFEWAEGLLVQLKKRVQHFSDEAKQRFRGVFGRGQRAVQVNPALEVAGFVETAAPSEPRL